jgi:hypothetical protein
VDSQTAQIYEQNDRLYLETFLIDNTVTKKGKKVNDKTIDDNVSRSRKHPLTLYPRPSEKGWIWDHPVIETNSLSENLELQKKYEIGYEIRSKKIRNGYWNAVYEITDPGAKNLFKDYINKTIPFWTSSGIIHSSKEDPLDIKDWRIIHNAIVSEPANGFEKSIMVDICQGTEQTCSKILTASITTKPSFSFCTQSQLQNYISSLSSLSGVFPYYTMNSESSAQGGAIANAFNPGFTDNNAKTGMGSIATNLTPPNPNPETTAVEKKQETTEDKTDYKAMVKQLEDQLKSLKTEKEAKETENKTVTERIASLERENSRNSRKNQVLSLAQGYPEAFMDAKTGQINQEAYSKTILEWIDKGFDDATIKELLDAKTLKFVSQLDKDGKCTTCSSLTAAAQNHQTTQMTTASMSDSDSSLPIWEKIIDLTNANIRLSAEKYHKLGGKY